jgi:hypothetical protein
VTGGVSVSGDRFLTGLDCRPDMAGELSRALFSVGSVSALGGLHV